MKLIALLLSIVLAFETSLSFAQVADPDLIRVESARGYSGALEDGDMLVVVEYRIDYAVLPTAAAPDNFIIRFMRGTTELNAAEIFNFQNSGYGLGVTGLYFSALDMTTNSIEFGDTNGEGYEAWIQGKPSAFPDPPKNDLISIITYRSASNTRALLLTDIGNLALNLQNDAVWAANNLTMLEFIAGKKVFTVAGESYFGQAIPNLQIMIPEIFRSSITPGEVFERGFDFSERDVNLGFWDNTSVGDGIDSVASLLRVDSVLIAGVVGLIVMGFFVFLANRISGHPEFGIISLAFTFPLVTAMGLGSMTALMLVGAIAVLGIGFALFLRRAG